MSAYSARLATWAMLQKTLPKAGARFRWKSPYYCEYANGTFLSGSAQRRLGIAILRRLGARAPRPHGLTSSALGGTVDIVLSDFELGGHASRSNSRSKPGLRRRTLIKDARWPALRLDAAGRRWNASFGDLDDMQSWTVRDPRARMGYGHCRADGRREPQPVRVRTNRGPLPEGSLLELPTRTTRTRSRISVAVSNKTPLGRTPCWHTPIGHGTGREHDKVRDMYAPTCNRSVQTMWDHTGSDNCCWSCRRRQRPRRCPTETILFCRACSADRPLGLGLPLLSKVLRELGLAIGTAGALPEGSCTAATPLMIVEELLVAVDAQWCTERRDSTRQPLLHLSSSTIFCTARMDAVGEGAAAHSRCRSARQKDELKILYKLNVRGPLDAASTTPNVPWQSPI